MKVPKTSTRLESILERAFEQNLPQIKLVGNASTLPLALLLSHAKGHILNSRPHLVIGSDNTAVKNFLDQIKAFKSELPIHVLPHFDVSPYSGLLPNNSLGGARIAWNFFASQARPGELFVASIGSLLQQTIDSITGKALFKVFKVGDELPSSLTSWLEDYGYIPSPLVEDVGQFAIKGGILDIFPPTHEFPIRIELYGDWIDSMRFFSPTTQMTLGDHAPKLQEMLFTPAREFFFDHDQKQEIIERFKESLKNRNPNQEEVRDILESLLKHRNFPGMDFFLPFFHNTSSCLEYFSRPLNIWYIDPIDIKQKADTLIEEIKADYKAHPDLCIRPHYSLFYKDSQDIKFPPASQIVELTSIDYSDLGENPTPGQLDAFARFKYSCYPVSELKRFYSTHGFLSTEWKSLVSEKLKSWLDQGNTIFIFARNQHFAERIKVILGNLDVNCKTFPLTTDHNLFDILFDNKGENDLIYIIPEYLNESLRIQEEDLIFLRDVDFLGDKTRVRASKGQKELADQKERLSFQDLNPGDYVVHTKHGIGRYEGLKKMNIQDIECEFLQIEYKDNNKLYLPVYRLGQLQRYSSANSSLVSLDKLGSTSFEKAKIKVKSHLKDIANELLTLYATRANLKRNPYTSVTSEDYINFSTSFPFEETEDQTRAIADILKDLSDTKPMDRLVCGDVGFGKTEVALRAAFLVAREGRQVAVLAPTTVLSFQHFETFKKRMKDWPLKIVSLNRFLSNQEVKKNLALIKSGEADIVIGTHRLLSKDVEFKNLGLLIIDEEQKFGVTHKEKVKKLKVGVDTLTLSATPIPRTLNMSLVGIKDLSFISTAPVDRLPTRTFTCKFDAETIKKAVHTELSRSGQIYFIHNRVQSIYHLADELREILPDVRIKIAHGQMPEDELESTMVAFFNHEIDMLICTSIVESGMDVQRANTIFIDNAGQLGLSQLYQLRGRVGRSTQRAYCYLLMPRGKNLDSASQERLKVIQENTALGSGIRVAQHDLELRGSGNLLGEEQSGHVNVVGYELYMDLLNEAILDAKGVDHEDFDLEPEINLRIPALIPDNFIEDIRLRLSMYKALSRAKDDEELSRLEAEMQDQFGPVPEPVLNLLSLMSLKNLCKELRIKDLTSGPKSISLIFTDKTPLRPGDVIKLSMRENKKYSISPDNRLNIRMNTISIAQAHQELEYLLKVAKQD